MKKRITLYLEGESGGHYYVDKLCPDDIFLCTHNLNSFFQVTDDNGEFYPEISVVISDKKFKESYSLNFEFGRSVMVNGEWVNVVPETARYFINVMNLSQDRTYYVGVEI